MSGVILLGTLVLVAAIATILLPYAQLCAPMLRTVVIVVYTCLVATMAFVASWGPDKNVHATLVTAGLVAILGLFLSIALTSKPQPFGVPVA